MTVKEFVDGYRKTSDNLKERYIKEKLETKNYISFADKCNLAQRIVNATTFEKDVDGKDTGNIRVNSVSRYLLFILSMIDAYTNIDVNFGNVIEEYDSLKSNDLLDRFINFKYETILPEEEYYECQTILNMTLDDTIQNNMSTQAFIQNQVTRFGTLLGVTLSPIMDKLADSINGMDESTIEKIGNQIEKMLKRIK